MGTISQGLVVFAGLLAAPVATKVDFVPPPPQKAPDPRLVRLQEYLKDCPINRFAEDFIAVADTYDLDWRLLPSISVVESSGGKDFRNNNVFGWGSCRHRFRSVREGIHIVGARLATSKLYRDKDIDQILRTYNPSDAYPARVKSVMNSIGSSTLGDSTAVD